MAMPEHVRERLRLHAAQNKGRTNLMGLDRVLGLVALDYAQEQDECESRWQLRGNGWVTEIGHQFGSGGVKTRYDEVSRVHSRFGLTCPWVRLSYAPEWLKDELTNRFPHRFISFPVRGVWQSAPVFPLGRVMEFLKFVWPLTNELGDRCKKYLTGYTENYTRRNPGVGAEIRMADTAIFKPGVAGKIIGVSAWNIEVVFDSDVANAEMLSRRYAGQRWVTIV